MRRWGEFDFGLKNEFFSQSLWNFLPIGPWDREGQGKNQLCEFGDRTTAFYSSWWDLFANPTQPHTRPSSPAWRTPIMHCNGKHHQTSTEPGIILKALLIVRICSQCFFIGKIKKWILSWWQWNKKCLKTENVYNRWFQFVAQSPGFWESRLPLFKAVTFVRAMPRGDRGGPTEASRQGTPTKAKLLFLSLFSFFFCFPQLPFPMTTCSVLPIWIKNRPKPGTGQRKH